QQLGLPGVLEWNSSAVWTRNHWPSTHQFKRLFTPLLTAGEQYVAARADLLAAVSQHAAAMAVAAGAPPARVVTVPNAVDLEEIDAGRAMASIHATGASSRPDGALIGWVGSFGVWHGAEVLVQAMSQLPGHVRA